MKRALILIVLLMFPGCRAIRRFGESHQSLAARRLSRQGVKAMRRGQWTMAEAMFQDALNISDANDSAHRGLAEALLVRGEPEAAIEHLEQAVQLSAGDPKQMQRLGQLYLRAERIEEAERQCEIALRAERDWAPLWSLRGDCLFARGRFDDALAAYHRALSLQPDYPHVQLQCAEIYLHQARHDRLLATLDRFPESVSAPAAGSGARPIPPGRADCLRGIAMRQLGRGDAAERHFVRAIEKDAENVTPRLHLAALALQEGRAADANALLAEATRLDPTAVRAAQGREATRLRTTGSGTASGKPPVRVARQAGPEGEADVGDRTAPRQR